MRPAAPEPLERIAGLTGEALVALLSEQASIYDGLGSGEAERVRAHVFAALAEGDLPEAALPFVLEELETGTDPASTAAAAMALRRAPGPVAGAEAVLRKAARRLEIADAPFPLAPGRTALQEVLATLAMLPGRGRAKPSCCASEERAEAPGSASADVGTVGLQDQSGARLAFADFFADGPSALAFFYTRCMNPERCSLTVTKLARLQDRLAGLGVAGRVRVGAVSYDPDYDLPQRLADYGARRGFRFDAHNRFFRTLGPVEPLKAHFELGVGYGPVTVNRHRIELFVLDAAGAVAASFTRRLWDEADVAAALAGQLATSS